MPGIESRKSVSCACVDGSHWPPRCQRAAREDRTPFVDSLHAAQIPRPALRAMQANVTDTRSCSPTCRFLTSRAKPKQSDRGVAPNANSQPIRHSARPLRRICLHLTQDVPWLLRLGQSGRRPSFWRMSPTPFPMSTRVDVDQHNFERRWIDHKGAGDENPRAVEHGWWVRDE